MIPFNTAQSLLQSESRSQGVVVTIRNMKRANIGQININQEYPTEPLDKIPARQGEFELAGKKTLAK